MRVIRIPYYASFCLFQAVEIVVVVRHPWMNFGRIISVPQIGKVHFLLKAKLTYIVDLVSFYLCRYGVRKGKRMARSTALYN